MVTVLSYNKIYINYTSEYSWIMKQTKCSTNTPDLVSE